MLQMICVDVDGTLVGTGNQVLPEVWEALKDARLAGIRIVLCSGRPAVGHALEYAKRLDPDGWHVFQNGASIVKVDTGESRSEELPHDLLVGLVEKARATERILETYTDREYAVEDTSPVSAEHAKLLGVPFQPRDLLSLSGMVVRAQWLIPYAEKDALLSEAHDGLQLHPASSPVMPQTLFVSVTRDGVNKGSAIRKVAGFYGFDLGRVMMVGDGHNDVTALEVVGYPVAMGNADKEARAAAKYHVGDVDSGGLVEAVELAMKE
ncbi:Cof-type HAD-IIB family hydrolase [Deinococcus psychrotolerans]|uniref:Cof-type HAD-IIB family hydrolase n=1 Tax=Deinococcus psychrotolerans TaxID=2489213 RepID=A0A3G8YA69_9DEIO|nr:Cof-type HAD-IIB family hydrolase [Deinococcus psychrotolerans]AZI41803.1 Cof-type HAD-IIB family hydrolase [Deinococcus psychrotolerans]